MSSDYPVLLRWLYDWQTLITGLVALAAAYVATRPVWRQASLAILDRLEARADTLESKRRRTGELITSVSFPSQSGIHDDDKEPDINPHVAFSAQQQVDTIIAQLGRDIETSVDGNLIDSKRAGAVRQCEALSKSLWAIHAPSSADFGGPDGPGMDEEMAYIEAGKRAERDLIDRFVDVSKAGRVLDEAFAEKITQLRDRIRQINDGLL